MARRKSLSRLLGLLISFLPGGPDEPSLPPSVPDPDEPGISPETRVARRRLLLKRYEKEGRGAVARAAHLAVERPTHSGRPTAGRRPASGPGAIVDRR